MMFFSFFYKSEVCEYPIPLVRVPDPKRGLEMKFRSESPATFVSLL